MLPKAIRLGEREIMVFPYGRFEHPKHGTLVFDDAFADRLIEHFRRGVRKIIPFVDQDHDEGKAAAWFRALKKQADGIYAVVEWTPLGESLLKEKLYRYFSPWFGRYVDEQTGRVWDPVFFGGALTNVPFLKVMPEVTLSEQDWKHRGTVLNWEDLRMAEWTQEYINDLPDAAFAVVLPGGEQDEQGKTVPRELRKLPHHTAAVTDPGDDDTVDLDHLRNALARLDQTDLPAGAVAQARRHLEAHARALEVGQAAEDQTRAKEEMMITKLKELLHLKDTAAEAEVDAALVKTIEDATAIGLAMAKLRELLGVKTDRELEPAVAKLKESAAAIEQEGITLADVKGLRARVEAAEHEAKAATAHALTAVKKLADKAIDDALGKALREGKIVPKQREWARAYAERDFDGFQKFLADAEPVISFRESGSDGEPAGVQLTDLERRIATQIGLSDEDLLRYGHGVKITTKKEEK